MNIKNLLLGVFVLIFSINVNYSQDLNEVNIKNTLRVNFLNPSLEYEFKSGRQTVISAALGVGYGGSYRELEIQGANGFVYIISPFIDMQYKWIYNRKNRLSKGKNMKHNSGNFVSFRGISRFASITQNVKRASNLDFAVGPTWGLQRSFGKIHLLFDIGPQYYFDTEGNSGLFPLMIQVNLGLNL